MSTTIITILVAIFGSNGLFSVIVLLINRHYSKQDKAVEDLTIMKEALEALSHDAYFRHCRRILAKDEITEEELENHQYLYKITEEELENHQYLYKAYHSQGLNGTGDRMHQLVLEKPVHVVIKEV